MILNFYKQELTVKRINFTLQKICGNKLSKLNDVKKRCKSASVKDFWPNSAGLALSDAYSLVCIELLLSILGTS